MYTGSVVVKVQHESSSLSLDSLQLVNALLDVWVPYWWSIFKYGCDKGLVCSVLYGTGANLKIVLPKTKCPASLVCHIVDVVIPVLTLMYGDAKESPLKQSLLLVLDSFLLLGNSLLNGQQFVIINNNNIYTHTPQRPHNIHNLNSVIVLTFYKFFSFEIAFDCNLFINAKNIKYCFFFLFNLQSKMYTILCCH